jgi:hypothetical protein
LIFTLSSWHKNLKTLKIISIYRPENNDWRRERVDGGLIGEDFDHITNISCFGIYNVTDSSPLVSVSCTNKKYICKVKSYLQVERMKVGVGLV